MVTDSLFILQSEISYQPYYLICHGDSQSVVEEERAGKIGELVDDVDHKRNHQGAPRYQEDQRFAVAPCFNAEQNYKDERQNDKARDSSGQYLAAQNTAYSSFHFHQPLSCCFFIKHIGLRKKVIKIIKLKKAKICKEVAKVGLIYFSHSQGKHKVSRDE
nr:hypothetical protein [Lachnoclostridium sp. MSJ-17]